MMNDLFWKNYPASATVYADFIKTTWIEFKATFMGTCLPKTMEYLSQTREFLMVGAASLLSTLMNSEAYLRVYQWNVQNLAP